MSWLFLGSATRILGHTSAPPLTNKEKWKPSLRFKFTVSLLSEECFVKKFWLVTGHVSVPTSDIIFAFSERVMPYFAQEPLSYLTLPTIKNAYKAFSIKINFRPDNVDGKELQISWSFYTFFLVDSCWCFSVLFALCCVLCLSYFLMCNSAASSVPPPRSVTSSSHPRGGKVSCCTPVSLSAWEPQELKCDFGSTALWLHQTFHLMLPAQSWFRGCERDGAWPLFWDRLFSQERRCTF